MYKKMECLYENMWDVVKFTNYQLPLSWGEHYVGCLWHMLNNNWHGSPSTSLKQHLVCMQLIVVISCTACSVFPILYTLYTCIYHWYNKRNSHSTLVLIVKNLIDSCNKNHYLFQSQKVLKLHVLESLTQSRDHNNICFHMYIIIQILATTYYTHITEIFCHIRNLKL